MFLPPDVLRSSVASGLQGRSRARPRRPRQGAVRPARRFFEIRAVNWASLAALGISPHCVALGLLPTPGSERAARTESMTDRASLLPSKIRMRSRCAEAGIVGCSDDVAAIRQLPAACDLLKDEEGASDGAQRGTMPVVGCAQATIRTSALRASAGSGTMPVTPETAIGRPSGLVERCSARCAAAPSSAPNVGFLPYHPCRAALRSPALKLDRKDDCAFAAVVAGYTVKRARPAKRPSAIRKNISFAPRVMSGSFFFAFEECDYMPVQKYAVHRWRAGWYVHRGECRRGHARGIKDSRAHEE